MCFSTLHFFKPLIAVITSLGSHRRGERDRALSEADSLREALSAIKDERRALLHDTGQFAHTHANVLKTLRFDVS